MDFFLQQLVKFLIEKGGIVDEEEQQKVSKLIYLFFGISFSNYRVNFSAQILMKELFGEIYGITNYKNFQLKGNLFYRFFYENVFDEVYQFSAVYFKKNNFLKAFSDENSRANLIENLNKLSKRISGNLSNRDEIKVIFNFKKEI